MTYNVSFLDNATSVMGVADGVNTMSGNLYAYLILFVLCIMVFISLKIKYDFEVCIISSAFITSVVAVFMFVLEWIPVSILAIPITLLFVSVFYAAASK